MVYQFKLFSNILVCSSNSLGPGLAVCSGGFCCSAVGLKPGFAFLESPKSQTEDLDHTVTVYNKAAIKGLIYP